MRVLRKIIHRFPSNKVTNAFCESDPAANIVPPASISRPSISLALIDQQSERESKNDPVDILVLSFITVDISGVFHHRHKIHTIIPIVQDPTMLSYKVIHQL